MLFGGLSTAPDAQFPQLHVRRLEGELLDQSPEIGRRWAEGSLQELPDIEAARQQFPILGWAVEPGDVIAFHMLSLHASGGVDGDTRRRVFSVRMLGDDITHAPRPWVTSPPFPGLADRLQAGAPMDDALFPVLWPG